MSDALRPVPPAWASPSNLFAALAGLGALLSFLVLFAWSGGDLSSFEWIGILGWPHALALVVVSTLTAKLWAWLLFRSLPTNAAAGAFAGAAIAVLTFLMVLAVHGAILATAMASALAAGVALATLVFGGLLFGLPSVVAAAILGAMLAKHART